MPRTVTIYKGDPSYENDIVIATEDELLAFCNKVREAGGAEILTALLPSTPSNSNACLIANALNFNCSVRGHDDYNDLWMMTFPKDMDHDRAQRIADAIGFSLEGTEGYYWVTLPPEIGNSAAAFDDGVAFQSFVLGVEDGE